MTTRSLLALTVLCTLFSCAKSDKSSLPPLVAGLKQEAAFTGMLPTSSPAVSTEVTLRRAALFNRTFLYGTSLQTSSMKEEGEEEPTNLMAIAVGQVPAEFRILDDKLRLVTDSRLAFESDLNHPSQLIQEYPILRQDAETITIRAGEASPALETVLAEGKKNITKRISFIRSMEYVADEELFLVESTIEMSDGSVAEFMETLTPRERLVPAGAEPIYADGDLNPLAKRFRFLAGDDIYLDVKDEGRVKTSVAQRFVLKDGAPIRWYVTRNIPAEFVKDVKNGVEAWNRYAPSLQVKALVEFAGLLPEGVKIGDPRYNVIVWDSVEDAGAAYESQASDPFTGVQTHSLIYLPYAWVKIGKAYWENAADTDARGDAQLGRVERLLKSRRYFGRRMPVNCVDGAHLHVNLASRESPEDFARGLLKAVVFHEAGHALGLAHNFKGSLSYDPSRPGTLFTSSIMDYNHYNEEIAAFTSVDSSDGPSFEYDRQILSVLYRGEDSLSEADPVLPACDDEEADSSEGGVDPLCVRYDLGSDPTKQAEMSLALLEKSDARYGRMSSLPVALENAVAQLPAAAGVTTVDEAKKSIFALLKTVQGTANIYIGGSSNSLAYLGSQVMKALYVFRDGTLPKTYDENAMRERTLTLLEKVAKTDSLPYTSKEALKALRESSAQWLITTPAIANLSENERNETVGALLKAIDLSTAAWQPTLLSKMRTRVISALKYSADAPLSFHQREGVMVDLEAVVIANLETLSGRFAGNGERPLAERLAAITVLSTYKKVSAAKEAAVRLREGVNVEIRATTDARKREALRKLAETLAW